MTSLASSHLPPGLHLHLVATGPTLRFALWLEGYNDPTAFKVFKERARVVLRHPGCLPVTRWPKLLPEGLPRWYFSVSLPRLGNGFPVALPGPMLAWDLSSFKAQGRTLARGSYAVEGFLLPPSL